MNYYVIFQSYYTYHLPAIFQAIEVSRFNVNDFIIIRNVILKSTENKKIRKFWSNNRI